MGTQAISDQNSIQTYQIQQKISKGRHPIYLSLNVKTQQQVALKAFPNSGSPNSNFLRETSILSFLDHPNIIKMINFQKSIADPHKTKGEQDLSYIALEYAAHGDLFDIIARSKAMSRTLTRSIFKSILGAISHMHENGIAHLDLKVENLLLTEDYKVKLTDFDLSQSVYSGQQVDSRGSPGFRSPEIRAGTCADIFAADVYSLGVILFILRTGIPPYNEINKGQEMDQYDAFYKALRQNNSKFWAAHSKYQNDQYFFEQEFIDLINQMLAEDPKQRPTLQEIKEHPWCLKDANFSEEEYVKEMKEYLAKGGMQIKK